MKRRSFFSIGYIALCIVMVQLVFVISAYSESYDSELIKLKTRSGVTQKFILMKPANPIASVVLIPGGVGNIKLGNSGGKPTIKYKKNFLIRTREEFTKQGLMVALIDAPSDKSSKGMYLSWRIGEKHVQDIMAVVSYLKQQANVPIWLVGTSNGTFSAINVAINSQDSVTGIVLTSSITTLEPFKNKVKVAYKTNPNGILDMDLGKITIPVLIVSHKDDECPASPASHSPNLKSKFVNSPKVDYISFSGGSHPKSKPCKALSQHGFYGIENQVVTEISKFIKSN